MLAEPYPSTPNPIWLIPAARTRSIKDADEAALVDNIEVYPASDLSEVIHFFSGQKMPEIVRLLGRYDCFGHKGTSEERQVLEFQ